jgi:hypothetical protein
LRREACADSGSPCRTGRVKQLCWIGPAPPDLLDLAGFRSVGCLILPFFWAAPACTRSKPPSPPGSESATAQVAPPSPAGAGQRGAAAPSCPETLGSGLARADVPARRALCPPIRLNGAGRAGRAASPARFGQAGAAQTQLGPSARAAARACGVRSACASAASCFGAVSTAHTAGVGGSYCNFQPLSILVAVTAILSPWFPRGVCRPLRV